MVNGKKNDAIMLLNELLSVVTRTIFSLHFLIDAEHRIEIPQKKKKGQAGTSCHTVYHINGSS